MSHLIKDAFYQEQKYKMSITAFSQADTVFADQKQQNKELSKEPLAVNLIEQSLSNFGKTAEGSNYSYLSFICQNQRIYSILGIQSFRHLQHIDVSHNNLLNLKPLSGLKYMINLNCSYNKLSKLLDFKEPPNQLMFVDSSFNDIEEIPDLSHHRFLKSLDLSNNQINEISGVNKNAYLQILQLANNNIENIKNLDDMKLVEINLFGNRIIDLNGLSRLPFLRKLDLSRNGIEKFRGLVDLVALRELRISDNQVKRVKELRYLENLVYLSVLDLCFNEIQNRRFYRLQVLYCLPGLRCLDGVNVSAEEVVKAENLNGMDLEDRKRIFNQILPDEEFIDRRINIAELIEPETESDNEDREFVDQYDEQGSMIKRTGSIVENHLSEMYRTGRSLQEQDYILQKSVLNFKKQDQ